MTKLLCILALVFAFAATIVAHGPMLPPDPWADPYPPPPPPPANPDCSLADPCFMKGGSGPVPIPHPPQKPRK